jgi:hypothetical protein
MPASFSAAISSPIKLIASSLGASSGPIAGIARSNEGNVA